MPVTAARDALSKSPGVQIWPEMIPDSGTIHRSAEFRAPTWRIPNGKGTIGDVVMQKFCTDVYSKLGLGRRGR
jgi:hypothetical protein